MKALTPTELYEMMCQNDARRKGPQGTTIDSAARHVSDARRLIEEYAPYVLTKIAS